MAEAESHYQNPLQVLTDLVKSLVKTLACEVVDRF